MANNKHHSDNQKHGDVTADTSGGTLDKAQKALGSSRDVALDAARRTAASLDGNPLGIVVGGLAVGVLAGALVPRSAREKELLAPIGTQLGSRARTAFEAAKGAGMDELGQRGLTRDGLRDQARGLFDGVTKALASAGAAAAQSARKTPTDG
jgi:hypothetical protein